MHSDSREDARRVVEREPHNPIAWILLAEAELDAGDASAGERASRRALALSPGHPEALARLGRAQWLAQRHQQAADSLRAAARAAPQHPGIAVWLGHALEDIGEAEAASEAYAHAHALAPQHPQIAAYLLAWRRRLCDWRDLDALSMQVRAAVRAGEAAVEPFAFLSEDASPVEQLLCARLRAAGIEKQISPAPFSQSGKTAAAGQTHVVPKQEEPKAGETATGGIFTGPLRVGFLSNGFGAHPTGLLTVALFEALQTHVGIEPHLFALNRDDGSAIRQRLRAAVHALHDVSMRSHAQIAAGIRTTRVDVLFDLRGWGGGGTPEVLAMRPAPVQVNWLAYPGTSGAPWIDYVLADAFVLPPALQPHFSEAVARLPRCFQPSDTTRVLAAPPTRAACGLPDHAVVYCSFNNSYKTNPASFARAMAVLGAVPGSVLWLLSGPGGADARLRDAALPAGVDPQRLVFMAKQPHPAYLARLQLADVFLDSNPYNAHTTASDALWAGCPVLTRPGDTFAARVAGSLNHHLGMDELNVADDEAYVALGSALGNDPARLHALRERLRRLKASSGLFDMAGFARDFAAIVVRMAGHHRAGLPPATIELR